MKNYRSQFTDAAINIPLKIQWFNMRFNKLSKLKKLKLRIILQQYIKILPCKLFKRENSRKMNQNFYIPS